jgi:RNA methyltransferase, TrmH family
MKALFTKVTSDTNQFIKLAKSLLEKKNRDKENLFIVEGFKLIDEAVKANFTLKYLYILEEESQNHIELDLSVQEAFKSATNNVEKIFLIPRELMKKLASTETPQEAVAIFSKKLDCAPNNKIELEKVSLYCENLQDPGNLGGIIRTTLASGCGNIFLDNCVDIYNPKLIRASAGAVFHIKFHEAPLEEFLKLKMNLDSQEKITLVATSPRAKYAYYDFKPESHEKIILMMGNEGKGLSEKAFSACDTTLSIPINPKVESLNVLAASTVLLFHFQSFNKRDLYARYSDL